MSKKTTRTLITGINGQDGHYLSELLLSKEREVFGVDLQADGPAV
jgi:GDP-D-mannose dehydratase